MGSKRASLVFWGLFVILLVLVAGGVIYYLFGSEEGRGLVKEQCEKYDEKIVSQDETDIISKNFICLRGNELVLKNDVSFDISQSRLEFLNQGNNEARVKVGVEPYDLIKERQALVCGLKHFEEDLSYQKPYENSIQRRYKTNIFLGDSLKTILGPIIQESFNIKNNQNYTLVSKTVVNGEEVRIEECAYYFDNRAKMLGI